jgi:hypothetical protein
MAYQSSFNRTPPSQLRRDFLRQQLDARIAQSKAAGHGPANFDYLLGDLNKQASKLSKSIAANMKQSETRKKNPTLSEINKAAKAHRVLIANVPSECFSELTWQDGIATGTFAKGGGAGAYEYDCTLQEFIEWSSSGSLGEWFADNIK